MLRFSMGIWLSVVALLTSAQQPSDFYSSSMLVPDQSSQVRHQAAEKSLAKVFVRISGTPDIVNYPVIQQALINAKSYLYEFEYSSTDETLIIDDVERDAVRLLMKFSASLIEDLLKSNQLPYWPPNRPDILLWAARADGRGGQQFVSNDSQVTHAFVNTAIERGVTLVKPVFDLEDGLALPVSRLWILDETAIYKASDRYQTDAILAGRLTPVDTDQWRASFTLFYQSQQQFFTAYGENTETIAIEIMGQVANYFSAIFTAVIDDKSNLKKLMLIVNNVDDFAAYANLLNYLENLPTVQFVSLITATANRVKVVLNYKGNQSVILRTLALDERLIEDKMEVGNVGVSTGSLATAGIKGESLQFIWQSK